MNGGVEIATTSVVTAAMREQYRNEGYFIVERVLTDDQLALLRDGAEYAMRSRDAEMEAAGVDRLRLNARGRRYFVRAFDERPELGDLLFSDTMAQICRATLGDTAYLFFEQYVIKAADPVDTAFGWHQDSGYIGHPDHQPYVTCWIALDDVSEENGSVHLLPYSRSGIRTYVQHVADPRVNDLVGYFGADPGIPVAMPAGSIAVFSSTVFHRSGPNLTDQLRRVYIAQYSGEVITTKDGSEPLSSCVPFLREGVLAADA